MEKTVASGSGNLELKQSEVFKAWDDFHDSMRRTTQAWLESLSEREKAVASREEQMEARESRFEAEFSSRKFQLQRIERSMEEKVYEVAERDEDLQSLESSIQKRREDLALVEESVAEKKEEFERLENEFSAMTRRAERKVASIRKTVRGYVTKMSKKLQSSIVKRRKEAELREAQWESDIKAKEEKLRAIANNIARCSDELRLQEERLEIVRKQAQSMCNAFDTCREEFELKEMKIDGLLKTLEEVEAQETNAESLQNPINAFGEAREISTGSLRKSPEEHFLGLQTEERQFREGASELELRREECSSSRKSMEVRLAQVKIESLEQPHTITSTVPITNAEISYMQYLLKLQSEKDNFGNEVYGILRASSNPEEFVLRAMEGLYPLQSSGEAEESNVRIVRMNCILLLEMLKEVAPQINSQVKVQAVKLVNDWVSRSKLTEIDYLEASRFIQLIKSYSLTSEIDSNDVFRLLDAAGQHGLSFQLRQAVSTTNRSSGKLREISVS